MNKRQYKALIRQLPKPEGAIEPTLPERINRLNPSERHDLQHLIRSLKLRKIVRRTLAEAFWAREEQRLAAATEPRNENATMRRLRAAVRTQESLKSYDSALTTFEPTYVRSSHGPGLDPPAIKQAIEHTLQEVPR